MAGIRSRDTRLELRVRKALHARGFRYRLHCTSLPGKPDLVFPRHHAVALIHSCFWHGHDCPLFRLPSTRSDFWRNKVARNRARDQEVAEALTATGWRRATVWECSIRGPRRMDFGLLIERVSDWLAGAVPELELRGSCDEQNGLTTP